MRFRKWIAPLCGPHDRDTDIERLSSLVALSWFVGLLSDYGRDTRAILAFVMPVPIWAFLFLASGLLRIYSVWLLKGGQEVRLIGALVSLFTFSLTVGAFAITAPMPGVPIYGTYAAFNFSVLRREWERTFG